MATHAMPAQTESKEDNYLTASSEIGRAHV